MYELLSLFFIGDRPLIVQFAASNPKDFADAAEIVAPWVNPLFLYSNILVSSIFFILFPIYFLWYQQGEFV